MCYCNCYYGYGYGYGYGCGLNRDLMAAAWGLNMLSSMISNATRSRNYNPRTSQQGNNNRQPQSGADRTQRAPLPITQNSANLVGDALTRPSNIGQGSLFDYLPGSNQFGYGGLGNVPTYYVGPSNPFMNMSMDNSGLGSLSGGGYSDCLGANLGNLSGDFSSMDTSGLMPMSTLIQLMSPNQLQQDNTPWQQGALGQQSEPWQQGVHIPQGAQGQQGAQGAQGQQGTQGQTALQAAQVTSGDTSIQYSSRGVVLGRAVQQRLQQIAQSVNCNYNDLCGVIFKESGFKTVPDNWNGRSAVGLIQWTQTAIDDLNQNYGLNLTKQSIARMSVMEQLDLAETTLKREKAVAGFPANHQLTAGELYAMNYAPANARQNVVARRGDGLYEGNEGLDINGDGVVTQAELTTRTQNGASFVSMA